MVRSINLITVTTAMATVLATVGIVHAEKGNSDGDGNAKQIIELPAIIVWGKAKRNAYPHTEATDAAVAAPHANYAPDCLSSVRRHRHRLMTSTGNSAKSPWRTRQRLTR